MNTIKRIVIVLTVVAVALAAIGGTVSASERGGESVIKFEGLVERRPSDPGIGTWVVSGRFVQVMDTTEINEDRGPASIGARVAIMAERQNGVLEAVLIRVLRPAESFPTIPPPTIPVPTIPVPAEVIRIRGFITALVLDEYLIVNGLHILLTDRTEITGELAVGVFVKVEAQVTPRGFVAIEVEVEPSPTNRYVEFEGVVRAIGDTVWLIDAREVTVDRNTVIVSTPEVGDRVAVRAQVRADGSLLAVRIRELPDAPPTPVAIRFEGVIERFPPNLLGRWVIGEHLLVATAQTEIIGTPAVGVRARVEALRHSNGNLIATKIVILEPVQTRTPRPRETVRPTRPPHPMPSATPSRGHSDLEFVDAG